VGDISTAALSRHLNGTNASAYDPLQNCDVAKNSCSTAEEKSLYGEGSAKVAATPMSVLPTFATYATSNPIRDYWVRYYRL
jgi:hypothetical protein